jgi:hypothetical protein
LISKKSAYTILFATCLLLLIPLIAMQFTNEVNWTVSDFIIAGLLLSFFAYVYKILTQTSNNKLKNFIAGLIVLGVLIFVWLSLI